MSSPESQRPARVWVARVFTAVEDVIYVGLGILLAGSSFVLLVSGLISFGQTLLAGSLRWFCYGNGEEQWPPSAPHENKQDNERMNQKFNTKGRRVKDWLGRNSKTPLILRPFAPLPLRVDFLPYTQLQLALKLAAGASGSDMSGFV